MSTYYQLKQTVKSVPFIDQIYRPFLSVDNMVCNMFGGAPDFIVTGTGRSGTVYISWLLNTLGIPTRHEYFYGPEGYNKRIGIRGEVSWLAAPFLDDYQGKIIHQTRHPVKTINSFYSIRAVDRQHIKDNKYVRFISQHFEMGDDLLENAMRFYIEWNGRISEQAQYHFQVEQLDETVPELMDALGYPCPPDYKDILQKSKKLNSKSTPKITYNDLPKGPLLDQLAAISESYGYQIDKE